MQKQNWRPRVKTISREVRKLESDRKKRAQDTEAENRREETDRREAVTEMEPKGQFKGSRGKTAKTVMKESDVAKWRLGLAFKGQGWNTDSMVVRTEAGERRACKVGTTLAPDGELCISLSVQPPSASLCHSAGCCCELRF